MKKTTLLTLICATLFGAKDIFVLEQQTVTAASLEQDELTYTAPIEIYTAADMEASKSKNIYDFLNHETSVITLPAFGNKFAQKIDMRGYGIGDGYENIVVVVNGRRMNNVDMVPQLLASIPMESVRKIEILKGAGSVEYGDGANAGVISITTNDFTGVNVTVYGGSNGTGYGSLGAGYADDLFSFSAFADYFETDGQRDLQSGDKKDSGRSKNGSFDLRLYPAEKLELRTGWAATRINTNYAGALTKAEYKDDPTQATTLGWDTNQHFDTDLWSFGLGYDFTSEWSLDANVFIEDKASDYGSSASKAEYDYDSGDLTVKYKKDALQVAVGTSFFNGQRDGYGSRTSKDNLAGFVKIDYAYNQHSFNAGGRVEEVAYEYRPETGSNLKDDETLQAYELGYNYKLTKEQALFASFSHSYQAPNIDRFFATTYPPPTFAPVVVFNGFIDPMKANTYNLGYNYFIDRNKFKAVLFYADITDEIYYTGGWTGVNTNLDETSKFGFELYDKYLILENLYVSGNYTYIEAEIEKDDNTNIEDKTLPGVSKHNLTAAIGYAPSGGSTLIISHTYRSSAYAAEDFENSFDQKQEVYNSTDFTASYSLENIELFAKVQNLFDEDNGLWINDDTIYPMNFERTFIMGLNGKF
ncbi:MAG: TonB-dependent receptor [Campylobacterota bacterium]|nr:TonB-dependent receptor [Campylobacterota bacterium]